MKRALLLLIPAVLVACSSAKSEDESSVGGDTSDLTELRNLGAIESSLGLTKDPERSRADIILKRGPCHKKLSAETREWDFRRYTTGAAFFYLDRKTEEPLSPVTCIDLDIDVGAQFPKVVELSGQSLDMALRFKLGKLGNFEPPQIPHDGIELMSFENGWISVVPNASPSQPNRAQYEGHIRGLMTGFFPDGLPRDRTEAGAPKLIDVMPSVAMLAHRYAKLPRPITDNDPIGFYKSIEDTSDMTVSTFSYVVKFDYARVRYESSNGAESLELINVMEEKLAGCSRVPPSADFQCWNIHGGTNRWEQDPRNP